MKRLADQTLYEILEVPVDASAEQIQAAYDRARATYGPGSLVTYTLMEPDEAAMLEARIEDARTTLLDPEKRTRYDEALQQPEEARAMASGGAVAAVATPPPVVPAVPDLPSAPQPEPEPASYPAILLGAPLEAEEPVADEPEAEAADAEEADAEEADAEEADAEEADAEEADAEEAEAEEPPPRPAPILLRHAIAPDAIAAVRAAQPPGQAAPAAARPAPAPAQAPAAASPAPEASAPPPAAPLPAPPLPDAWSGEALRQVRESRGLSVIQISEKTKVTRHHIENIEADRFAALPAQVYLRGILLTIARELRLDGQKVARSYIERIAAGATATPAQKPR